MTCLCDGKRNSHLFCKQLGTPVFSSHNCWLLESTVQCYSSFASKILLYMRSRVTEYGILDIDNNISQIADYVITYATLSYLLLHT